MQTLSIHIIEEVFLEDVVAFVKSVISIILNVVRVLENDLVKLRTELEQPAVNGPPTLGVSVADESEVKAVFG
jgi:hypothetical protein